MLFAWQHNEKRYNDARDFLMELIEKAAAILKSEVLCDRCLGRCFARLGCGLSNRERGRALRVVLAMWQRDAFQEPESCAICREIFQSIDSWVKRAIECAKGYEFQTYLMGARVPSEIEEAERALWGRHQISQEQAEPLRREFNREVGKRFGGILAGCGRRIQVDFHKPEIVFLIDLEREELQMQVHSFFVYGRYRKLIRGIPQTKWPCRQCHGRGCPRCRYTGKMYSESVEELIAGPLLEASQGEGHAFHGAGREDIDALMLGSGRPFVLEISKPRKRSLNLSELERAINGRAQGKVEVEGLRFVESRAVEEIKRLEAEKSYRAQVVFERDLKEEELQSALKKLVGVIEQRTPRRVSHRRADLVRTRRVLSIEGRLIGPREALIELICEGGLYVKELISGDEGRTRPSLAELLRARAQVTELDVLEVRGRFPD